MNVVEPKTIAAGDAKPTAGRQPQKVRSSMQPRSNFSSANFGASARRRIRRSNVANRLFCSTNGCATYLQPDESGTSATCPICGARRTIH